jgi:hypothetical protein
MTPGLWQSAAVCGPPGAGFRMLAVEVEHVDTGCSTCCDANQRARVASPEFAQTTRITPCLLEAIRGRGALVFGAWKAEPPIRTHRQSLDSVTSNQGGNPCWSGVPVRCRLTFRRSARLWLTFDRDNTQRLGLPAGLQHREKLTITSELLLAVAIGQEALGGCILSVSAMPASAQALSSSCGRSPA